jgi:hypothetical protein
MVVYITQYQDDAIISIKKYKDKIQAKEIIGVRYNIPFDCLYRMLDAYLIPQGIYYTLSNTKTDIKKRFKNFKYFDNHFSMLT